MNTSFELVQFFPVSREELFNAWLDSNTHSEMTGGEARFSVQNGGTFGAWDGYITGMNLAIIRGKEIFQYWRTTDFKEDDPDSELTLIFTDVDGGSELTIKHSGIPEGQPDYNQGWIDHYFTPMTNYFSR